MSDPQDPYGQQQGPGQQYQQQGYQYGQPGYGQQQYPGGYAAPPTPRKPLELAKIVTIAAWVVLGCFALAFLYALTQDDFGSDFADRLFSNLPQLGTGVFYAGVLLAVGVWLRGRESD
ncbi:MAG TPA: hypothetical protein VFI47_13780 [Acidimicrobiales bacterium]|nr:hypothetical protein [Acidimicrobiales bacterium]